MSNPIVLRWSSILAFMHCQRKYQLAYVKNISRKPGIDSRALILGSHVHAGIQAALESSFKGRDTDKQVFAAIAAVRQYNRENTELGRTVLDYETRSQVRDDEYYAMMTDVLIQAEMMLRFQIPRIGLGTKYRVASVGEVLHGSAGIGVLDVEPMIEWKFEQTFQSPNPIGFQPAIKGVKGGHVYQDYIITGTIDTVLQDIETGEYLIFDWKTRSVMPREKLVDLDGQLRLYAAIVNRLAGRTVITQTCQYQMRTSVPKQAELTTKGKVSMAAIASTWAVWSKSLIDMGLDPADYEEQMRPKLRAETDYTNPIFTPVTPLSSKLILENVLRIGEAIRYAETHNSWPSIPSLTGCQFCSFTNICRVQDFGGDVDYVVESEYVIATPDDEVEPEVVV